MVIDAESDPFLFGRVPRVFLWGLYDGEEYRQFTDTQDLIDYIRPRRLLVYGHNGGKFDFHYLLGYLDAWRDTMIINDRLTVCFIGESELRDSFAILPIPLREYRKIELPLKWFEEAERARRWKEITERNKADCVDLWHLIEAFHNKFGRNCYTIAQAAMAQWKMISGDKVPNSGAGIYEIIKPWYLGGRTEVFKYGEAFNVHSYDINSAYPAAMLKEHAYGVDFRETTSELINQGFYRVNAISYGALPLQDKDGTLTFPKEPKSMEFYATGWELIAGIATGTIENLEIIHGWIPCEMRHFAPYVHRFYAMKRANPPHSPDYIFAKLMLNSLYGKFGADPSRYWHYKLIPPRFIKCALEPDGEYVYCGDLGPWGLVRKPFDDIEKRYYNVATAASITGAVRAQLHIAICYLRERGYRVLYCDTDSIITDGALQTDEELGGWKDEGRFDYACIANVKCYAMHHASTGEWKTASAGAPLKPREIIQIATGHRVRWKSAAPTFSIHRPPSFIQRSFGADIH